jgi:hypothetical protein
VPLQNGTADIINSASFGIGYVTKKTTVRIGIASRAQMKARTLAVARGEHKRAPVVHFREISFRLSGRKRCASGETDEPIEPAMKIFGFSIIASGLDPEEDEVLDRFYEAGCDDATIGVQNGRLVLAFVRGAACLDDAVASATANVRAAGATVHCVEPCL